MKWYTCIVHVPWHVSPVQYLHTRAETPQEAEKRAEAWLTEPDKEKPDVEFVFEGKLEPEAME